MNIRYGSVLSHLNSFIITIIAWLVPLALVSIMCKDLPDTDVYIADKTGNLFTYVIIVSVLLGSVHWLLNKITDIPTIFDENFALVTQKINLQYIVSS
jgi:hypothetical protein